MILDGVRLNNVTLQVLNSQTLVTMRPLVIYKVHFYINI